MEVFQEFSKIYNNLNTNRPQTKMIPPSEESLEELSKKISIISDEMKEKLYLFILHYHYITTNEMTPFPYGLKTKNNKLQVVCSNLPSTLQHMLIEVLN